MSIEYFFVLIVDWPSERKSHVFLNLAGCRESATLHGAPRGISFFFLCGKALRASIARVSGASRRVKRIARGRVRGPVHDVRQIRTARREPPRS
ncbi:hypothetical protein, partial [Burkholderia pseudomallei]|uniref:hypothetical protein n=1 Tax=Burkholderia pseudomallei TaxID=28450 RepID=UPI0015E0A269